MDRIFLSLSLNSLLALILIFTDGVWEPFIAANFVINALAKKRKNKKKDHGKIQQSHLKTKA